MEAGLESVVAAHTVLSDVDGEAGRLVLRGAALEDLAGVADFETVCARLWSDLGPDLPSDLRAALGAARAEVWAEVAHLDDGLVALSPVEGLRALMARLADGEGMDAALRVTAAPAVFTGALLRRREGLTPLAPDPEAPHAADLLRMILGRSPTATQAATLDAYLVTVIDHGLNASTFAARVTASTRAGLVSAALAGISALKGPLHGGAPGPVIDMLDGIGSPGNARPWLEAALDRGDRLMGFGHRVYRVRDPRADALKAAIRRLGVDEGRLALGEAVEAAALEILRTRKPDRPLETNVEFYTALLLEALGIPSSAFTCIFAAGRAAGWVAHAWEQVATGRLIRPRSVYVGPQPSALRAAE
ncbi:citrate synthase/methylcitrate synthase [Phenylobacterium sp.]|uniref:citrate synthase/methylcitrate synthase n=1 Tax=Phenylobacterium sp. TaxID=1871053 RepID=UPI0025F5A64B|nr:citrate synthase/methylcitrate synthase [Phenylobacterium sp.]MCA3736236.1 citrate synthase/methylcitrate synthase [Phenylobacterium sp.]MCA3739581.1 citrate synthase/methylcitrate synthase [Phenylobacterium sp.]